MTPLCPQVTLQATRTGFVLVSIWTPLQAFDAEIPIADVAQYIRRSISPRWQREVFAAVGIAASVGIKAHADHQVDQREVHHL